MSIPSGFDSYAGDYEAALDRGLSLTGESREYFAKRRVEIVAACCHRLGLTVDSVCDFGCGTGDTLPILQSVLGSTKLLGLDPSTQSLATARARHRLAGVELATPDQVAHGSRACDAIYCNGVFHHIPPAERLRAALHAISLLRPGGCWFFWENNPFNPGTRWAMARIPFDHDAIMLRPAEARQLLTNAGTQHLETSFHFYFPKILRQFRGLEEWLVRLPLGGQYLTVFQRPV